MSPPSSFSIIKGALDGKGPVLTRTYGKEEVNISVMRLANIIPGGGGDDDEINQLFLYVTVSKPEQRDNLQFLCGLYPDALGIHSVSMRPKAEPSGFFRYSVRLYWPRIRVSLMSSNCLASIILEFVVSDCMFLVVVHQLEKCL